MTRYRIWLTLSLSLFAVLTMPNSAAVAQRQARPSVSPLALEPCRLPGWNEDVRCGKYEVYEDRQAKTGRRITLKVVVLPATGARKSDPVFYFAGGPGGSATETATRAGQAYLADLRRDHDLVFVDQRGTGGSNPLSCDLYGDKNEMAAYFGELFVPERLRACRAELEKVADLKLYSTLIAMDDLDEVRAALGYEKINLYGGSYGSTAALVYLRRHPQSVRAAAILGVSPPVVKILLPIPKGVQQALDHIFADCAADEKCRAEYPDLRADFAALLKRLEKGPVRLTAINPFTGKPQQITLERSAFNEHLRAMLYQPSISRWLPLLIHQGAQGDFGLFASIGYQTFRGLDDAIARGMHFSVVCGEDIRFITDEEATHSAGDSFYGDGRLKAYRRTCEIWPAAEVATDFASPVKSPAPVLLISGEADPVTPPWAAEEASKHLSNSRHLIVPKTGHYFNFTCVNRLISEFISRGSAADLDPSCTAQIRRPAFVTAETMRVMAGGSLPANQQAAEGTEEVWQGRLDTGPAKLRLMLRLGKTADGKLAAKMDSPDQLRNGLPVDEISWKDQTLYFEMNLIGAAYQGMINPDKSEIRGEWRQQGRISPLVFKRVDKTAK